MKLVLVFSAFVAIAVAAPQGYAPVRLTQYDEQRDESGQFSLSYQAENGITVTRQGALKPTADGDYVLIQSGSHSYTSPEGIVVRQTWTADEDGFHPVDDKPSQAASSPSGFSGFA